MKRFIGLAMAMVMSATMLAGCGDAEEKNGDTSTANGKTTVLHIIP